MFNIINIKIRKTKKNIFFLKSGNGVEVFNFDSNSDINVVILDGMSFNSLIHCIKLGINEESDKSRLFCKKYWDQDKNTTISLSYIGDKKYYLSVDSFFQINKSLTKKLYDEVLDVAISLRPNKVLDLYCGTGTIGIYVAEYCKKVISVDYSLSNINDAIDNMKLNNINNIEFINDKVENVIDKFDNIDLVIVDPPRAGLDKKTIDNLIRIGSDTIVYVSCDPATLVRDLDLLSDMYDVMYIKPFNMFPRTYHVEAFSVLKKK